MTQAKFEVVLFSMLEKIGKVQLFDLPEKHYDLIQDFTIIKGFLQ